MSHRTFCFAHLDLDLYLSTKQALDFIAPWLVLGGVLVLNDYGAFDAPGTKKAVAEVIPQAEIHRSPIDPSRGSQAYWIKP